MIEYVTEAGPIRADQIDGFFVGWPEQPTPQQLIQAMDASYRRVWALDGERVVGYTNAISDGVLTSFIPWLEVHADYQNRGIGRELVKRIIAQLDTMYTIDLCCDPQLIPYYERLGFTGFAGAGIRQRGRIANAPAAP